MKKLLTVAAMALVLFSCTKEDSLELPARNEENKNPGSPDGNGLLVRTVAKTGAETSTTIYTYDHKGRLHTQTDEGVAGGFPIKTYKRFERDSAGRIVRIVQKAADINGVPSDTAVHRIHYPDASTLLPDYSIHIVSMSLGAGIPPLQTIDSSVYHYNGEKLLYYDAYLFSTVMGGRQLLSTSKWSFAYNAASLVVGLQNTSDIGNPGGDLEEQASWTYSYGAAMNNVYSTANGMQNFFLHGLPNVGAPVMTKMEMVGQVVPVPVNVSITTTHQLGPNNKITTASATTVVSGQPTRVTNFSFYYL